MFENGLRQVKLCGYERDITHTATQNQMISNKAVAGWAELSYKRRGAEVKDGTVGKRAWCRTVKVIIHHRSCGDGNQLLFKFFVT